MIAFFNRRQVKTLARQHLREHGWLRAVLAAFVSAVLIQLFTELRSTLKMVSRIQDGASWLLSQIELPTEWASLSAGTLAVIEAVVSVLSVMILLYTLFLGGIFQLGRSAWFLRFCRGEKPPLTGIFGAFRYYGRAFFTHFLITLY
ncbi:MAG: hypothetical protein IJZ13_08905, partial [Clostridia bacterium]|nr:hypothetical protein [Clostridia bacterium]